MLATITGSPHSGSFHAGSLFQAGGADDSGVDEALTPEGTTLVGVGITVDIKVCGKSNRAKSNQIEPNQKSLSFPTKIKLLSSTARRERGEKY
jgi:hypothetical protein